MTHIRIFQVLTVRKRKNNLPHYFEWVPVFQGRMAQCLAYQADNRHAHSRNHTLSQIQEAGQ